MRLLKIKIFVASQSFYPFRATYLPQKIQVRSRTAISLISLMLIMNLSFIRMKYDAFCKQSYKGTKGLSRDDKDDANKHGTKNLHSPFLNKFAMISTHLVCNLAELSRS